MSIGNYELPSSNIRYVHFHSLAPAPTSIHEHFELIYIEQGTAVFTIDDREITLSAGDLSFTPSFCPHSTVGGSEDLVADALVFSPHVCSGTDALFAGKRLLRPYLKKEELSPLLLLLTQTLFSLASKQQNDFGTGKTVILLPPNKCPMLAPYLAATMAELASALPTENADFKDYNLMRSILSYCSMNYTKSISRETVAVACGVCPNTVSKVFSELNVSFPDHINTLRVNLAYRLLTETQLNIGEVMDRCGYINQGTFNRNFMTAFGLNPKAVRKNPGRSYYRS